MQNFAKYLQQKLRDAKPDVDIKYIDPTYMVRACRTNGSDAIYCSILGQNAVHAAFSGFEFGWTVVYVLGTLRLSSDSSRDFGGEDGRSAGSHVRATSIRYRSTYFFEILNEEPHMG